jgi:hypothetical protein
MALLNNNNNNNDNNNVTFSAGYRNDETVVPKEEVKDVSAVMVPYTTAYEAGCKLKFAR